MEISACANKEALDVLREYQSSPRGLSQKEAAARLAMFGLNEMRERRTHWLAILGRQFHSPFFYLLLGAGVIALGVKEIVDGCVILAFIFVNVTLGFLQEHRSEKAIALLKKYVADRVRAMRDGKVVVLERRLLVPGDVVLVENGDIVPADLRALRVHNLMVDESVLTGESTAVGKQAESLSGEFGNIFGAANILFSGTAVVSGKAEGVVVKAGQDTAMAGIVKLAAGLSRPSLYEKNLLLVSRLMMKIVVSAIAIIFVAKLVINGFSQTADFLIFCVALVVSILPEALPVVTTFALSEGALKLAREKVVARRLSAIEDLGNIEVLCCDKTGTLTQNKLTLEGVVSDEKERCVLFGLLTSAYAKEDIDSTVGVFDAALWQKSPQDAKERLRGIKIISELPFDSVRMRNSVLVEDEQGERWLIIKGASETILPVCSKIIDGQSKEFLIKEIKEQGLGGKRVLALAFKSFTGDVYGEDDERDLTFLGYLTFLDPLKDTAKEALGVAKKLGVRVKIITGDSVEVASMVARQTGLINHETTGVISGFELESMNEASFDSTCDSKAVFARVTPEIKHKIIRSLQKKYEVGFMGEGANDAPALKAANVGIVVQEASDIAREVADIVLTQKDLRVVVNGIKNGRMIFSNINKYIKCALASNFGNFYSIAIISLFIPFLPMLPVQILLGNLLSDFPLITIATDSVDVEELNRPKVYQLNHMISLIIILALVSTLFDFIFFAIFHDRPPAIMQTLWFMESILTEIALIFSIRTSYFFLKAKRPSWPLLAMVMADAVFIVLLPFLAFGQNAFHFVAPPLAAVGSVIFLVFNYFIVSELVKLAYFKWIFPRHRTA